MKKLYAIFFMMLATVISASAAVSFTVKINMPDQVTAKINYSVDVTLTGETTTLTCEENQAFSIELKNPSDYSITSLVNKAGTPQNFYSSSANLYPTDGEVYTVTISAKDDLRTESFTLKVDDASKIQMRYNNGDAINTTIQGGNVANVIKYNPAIPASGYGGELPVMLMGANGASIYKVSIDGTPVAMQYGSYALNVTDGCLVEIQANYPDEPCTVTFVYEDGAEGFFSSIKINDADATVTDGKLTARLGDKLSLTGNTADYTFEGMSVGGIQQSYVNWPWSTVLLADTEIKVKAHPKAKITFTINIDNVDNVKVYNSQYSYSGDPIMGLVNGNNTLSVPEDNLYICLAAQPTCTITSVTDADANNLNTSFLVSEGMTVYVTTSRLERNLNAVLWLDCTADPAGDIKYFSAEYMYNSDHGQLDGLRAGYNLFDYAAELNPLTVSWYNANPAEGAQVLYVDGVKQSPVNSGTYKYEVTVTDGSVIKAFVSTAPADATVTFTADGTVDGVKVTRDVITEVPVWDGLTDNVFAGTQYSVTGSNIKVKVNGTDVAADADGAYTFEAKGGANAVTVSAVDGIASVGADTDDTDADVYNLQGIRVGTRSQLGTLPAGIYISAGRKYIVK